MEQTTVEQAAPAAPVGQCQAWRQLLAALRGRRPEAIRRAWQELRERQAVVELWQGEQRIRRLELHGGRTRIGRDSGCELPVELAGVSRVHAILELARASDRDYTLEDFNSANGLFHRDRRIKTISLRDGDAVWLGSPLKGDAPVLRYQHPRSALEQAIHWLGMSSLVGSSLMVTGMLAVATVAGGSKIRTISGPVKIFSAAGQQIDAKEGSSTALPTLQSYPLHLRQALMASEEARFGWNSGLDLFGTLRSVVRRSGGGSGLTQQVARMVYPDVGRDLSLTRKLRELWVALQLEVGFSKNEILKLYLDRAYLGLGTEGFEQAAQLYFRKSASDLDVAQSAFLVGLLPSPNGYSPCNTNDPGAGLERRNLVLKLMHEQGWLSDQGLIDAQRKPLNIDPSACRESNFASYPYFSDYVIGELEGTRFGLNISRPGAAGNYAVFSTISPKIQSLAQSELKSFLEGPAATAGLSQGALITLNFNTGDILAYVGGGDYRRSSFDRVQAMRQPGSTFKLFPYLAALESGLGTDALISCDPLFYVAGCRQSGGDMSMRSGFAFSENVIALRLAERAGLTNVNKLARRLGITTPLEPDYNTMLGGRETYLYELARAYSVVANGGRSVPMHGVNRIYDLGICQSIKSLRSCPDRGITVPIGEKSSQLLRPEIAARMDQMLFDVVKTGTARVVARLVPDARGKTGTTNNAVDVLFIGYSPSLQLLTAVWMGNDNNQSTTATGAMAAYLWAIYMNKVSKLA